MEGITAVLFDLGETLLDETRMWDTWADRLGVPRFTFHALAGAAIARGEHPETVIAALGGEVDDGEPESGDVTAERFEPRDLYDDAMPVLAQLRARGYRVGVGGNQPPAREAQVRALGLPVDVVVSSASLGVEKPSPEFFAGAARALGVEPPAMLSVGDRVDNDVLPALAAGCRAAFLRRGPWGILQAERSDVREADLVVGSLDELLGELPSL
jgi:FMN phosphatase YigB (HAD superfamily)